jgi:hypothetical protein
MRAWVGPLTIGSFFVVAVTGILMLVHFNQGIVKPIHEIVSCLFVVFSILHIIVNGKIFLAYFRKPLGMVLIGICIAICVMSMIPIQLGNSGGHGGRGGMMKASESLQQSSLELAAQVANRDVQAVIDNLKSKGIQVRDDDQTLVEIAKKNSRDPMEVLMMVLSMPKG